MIAFFNSSIGVADLSSDIAPKEVAEYKIKKQLTMELIGYISRDIRERYRDVMNDFYTKYERTHINNDSSKGQNSKKSDENMAKQAKNNLEDIAKKRAEYKKIAKMAKIDSKLKKPVNMTNSDEVKNNDGEHKENPSQGSDKQCIICYKNNNLYVSK